MKNPVGNIDIAPTLLDIAGVKKPDYMDGRSLLDLIGIVKRREFRIFEFNKVSNFQSPQVEDRLRK